MNLRDFIREIAPPPLSAFFGERYVYTVGLLSDAVLQKMVEGIQARIPTYGDDSALPLLGDDRSIMGGLLEPGTSYAGRLKRAFTDWQRAGMARARMQQILGYLYTPRARTRTVTNSSRWETYEEGSGPGDVPEVVRDAGNWDWDSSTVLPSPAVPILRAWIRIWSILYATPTQTSAYVVVTSATNTSPIVVTTATPHGLTSGNAVSISGVLGNTNANGLHAVNVLDPSNFELKYTSGNGAPTYLLARFRRAVMAPGPAWGAFGLYWGAPDVSWGLSVPSSEIDALRAVSGEWKGAHAWLLWLIVSFDNALFDPSAALPSAELPDGTWGHWGKTVGGVRVKARNASARYCTGIA